MLLIDTRGELGAHLVIPNQSRSVANHSFVQHAELESAYACAALRHDKSSRTEHFYNSTGVRNEIVKDGTSGRSRLVTTPHRRLPDPGLPF
jgi:hypothetical protein